MHYQLQLHTPMSISKLLEVQGPVGCAAEVVAEVVNQETDRCNISDLDQAGSFLNLIGSYQNLVGGILTCL